jgi:hypothetical protein
VNKIPIRNSLEKQSLPPDSGQKSGRACKPYVAVAQVSSLIEMLSAQHKMVLLTAK